MRHKMKRPRPFKEIKVCLLVFPKRDFMEFGPFICSC